MFTRRACETQVWFSWCQIDNWKYRMPLRTKISKNWICKTDLHKRNQRDLPNQCHWRFYWNWIRNRVFYLWTIIVHSFGWTLFRGGTWALVYRFRRLRKLLQAVTINEVKEFMEKRFETVSFFKFFGFWKEFVDLCCKSKVSKPFFVSEIIVYKMYLSDN